MDHLSNWIELPATNITRARRFYEQWLGIELHTMELGGNTYALFPARNRYNTGALVQGPGYVPADTGPLIYLDATGRIDQLVARATEAGGAVVLPRMFLSDEAGEIAIIRDTEGNRIGLQSPVDRPRAAPPVSDADMRGLLGGASPCHAFLLRKGPAWEGPTAQQLQWEHGRNMFMLMRDGRLRYVCALTDGSDVVGFGVAEAPSRDAAAELLRADPAVRGGRLTCELLNGVAFTPDDVR